MENDDEDKTNNYRIHYENKKIVRFDKLQLKKYFRGHFKKSPVFVDISSYKYINYR